MGLRVVGVVFGEEVDFPVGGGLRTCAGIALHHCSPLQPYKYHQHNRSIIKYYNY